VNCEEFELIGLESRDGLQAGSNDPQLAAAVEHAATCSRCAALADSWQEARSALRTLRDATQSAEAPQRVEMQLRREFASRHRPWRSRSAAIFAAWTLATATLLFAGVSWWNWRVSQNLNTSSSGDHSPIPNLTNTSDDSADSMLVADNSGDFTMLPGSLPQETDDAAIVRVRMQRGALSSFGLPVNEERLGDWIQVDLLVGQDGQPKAVRFPDSEQSGQSESNF
jgi:hypothetical protein